MRKKKEHSELRILLHVANGYPKEMSRKSLINNPKAKAVSQTERNKVRDPIPCVYHTSSD